MNVITAVCLILCEGQVDTAVADAVISARDGGKVPVPTSGMLVLSARNSIYGSARTSLEWEVEPEFLDTGNRSERAFWKEADGTLNPVLIIGYADCPESALIYDAKTQSRGIVVRLYVAKGDTQDRDKVFIAIKGNIPPPKPEPEPNPEPEPPKPTPVPDRQLLVYMMDDVTRRDPAFAKLLQDDAYWTHLSEVRGHKWRVFDKRSNEPMAIWMRETYSDEIAKGAVISILDASNRRSLVGTSMPKTTAELDALLKRYSSR